MGAINLNNRSIHSDFGSAAGGIERVGNSALTSATSTLDADYVSSGKKIPLVQDPGLETLSPLRTGSTL